MTRRPATAAVVVVVAAAAVAPLLALSPPDARTGKLVQSLQREAQDFVKGSGKLFAEETLTYAARAEDGGLDRHTVVSQYSFAAPRDRTQAVREIRQVLSADGKSVKKDRGLEAVAMAVSAGSSDKEKLRLLEQWERYGVRTVATDLGQLLLLFAPESIVNYEFQLKARQTFGEVALLQFTFNQLDGPGSMSVYKDGEVQRPKLSGEVWVQESDYRLVRVALFSHSPTSAKTITRQEIAVVYGWWPSAGCVMPAAAMHREHQNGMLRVENRYSYGPYKLFDSAAAAADSKGRRTK